jgi:unsaturated rhamnogalacturonyl hydrolase
VRNHGYPEHPWFDPRLELRDSPVHGRGVYARAPIAAGEVLQVIGGLVFRRADPPRVEPGVAYNEGQLDEDLWIITPVDVGLGYFFNHSCDPNSTGLRARRDIAAGDEVTMDYAIEIAEDGYELSPCRCGTALCRGRVTGDDWRRPDLQARYGDDFFPFLRRRIAVGKVLPALLAMQRLSWEQGVASQAALDLGHGNLARALARDAVTRQAPDGRLAAVEDNIVNGAANAEAVRVAGFTEAYERQLAWLDRAPRAADGTLFHVGREVWADTVYMAVPALVAGGRLQDAERQLDGHRRRLFDEAGGLYAHRWDEDRRAPARAAHWAGGNGWVVAAIARAGLGGRWEEHARDVVAAMLRHRTAAGLFHDVLDDPGTFEEVSTVCMLAYAVLAGGFADRAVGEDLLETARRHVDPDGLLTPACGSPHFDRPGTSPEAQSFFLMAAVALGRPGR